MATSSSGQTIETNDWEHALSSASDERSKIFAGIVVPMGSSVELGGEDEYILAFLRILLDRHQDKNSTFKEREKLPFDEKLLTIDNLSFNEREKMKFVLVTLQRPLPTDFPDELEADTLGVYIDGDAVQVVWFNGKIFVKGYTINFESGFYKEAFTKTIDLAFSLKVLRNTCEAPC